VEEKGTVELLIVSAMTAFHTAIVALAALRITGQLGIEWLEELIRQAQDLIGVVATELLPPIGLKGDGDVNAESTEPQRDKDHEGQAVGAVQTMTIG
jgi:hypothetical protein